MHNVVNTLAVLFFIRTFFVFAGKKDNNKVSNEFEIWPDRIKDCGVSCP